MITKTTYVARDGKEFQNQLACQEYEHDLENTVYVVVRDNWAIGVYRSRADAETKAYGTPCAVVTPVLLT